MTKTEHAVAVPLVERMRSFPHDYCWDQETHFMEDGACVGHHHWPVGRMLHDAADEIERLERELQAARVVALEDQQHFVDALVEMRDDCETVARDDSVSVAERRTWRAVAAKCTNAIAKFAERPARPEGE